jgi:hypothetical protein
MVNGYDDTFYENRHITDTAKELDTWGWFDPDEDD